jgi:hypothetical protein
LLCWSGGDIGRPGKLEKGGSNPYKSTNHNTHMLTVRQKVEVQANDAETTFFRFSGETELCKGLRKFHLSEE